MSAESILLPVIDGTRRDPGAAIMRTGLAALAYVYSAGLKAYLLPYRIGIRRQAQLPCPVISIGNLSVGGTGKTPMTQLVCRLLTKRGVKPCILSRGYRGKHEYGQGVVSTESRVELNASDAGDEAYLLARSLPGVPVIVGKDRRKTGRMAIERFHPDAVVLDDGMQFYQLRRDLDIVLIDAQRPFDNGWTFPRGLLREPPSHIRRAGCVVITNVDKVDQRSLGQVRQQVERLARTLPIFEARYCARRLAPLDGSSDRTVEWLRGRKVAALSGLGNPENFERQIIAGGGVIVHSLRLGDHDQPTMTALTEMMEEAQRSGAEAIIVTEKDAVKLPPIGRPLPFLSLEVAMQIDDEPRFSDLILRAVRK